MALSRPLDKFVTDSAANRIFLVDPDTSRSDAKTYRELLRDLDLASRRSGSELLPNHLESHETMPGSLYDYLVRLFASIINNQSITLDDIAHSRVHSKKVNEPLEGNESFTGPPIRDGEPLYAEVPRSIEQLRNRILNSSSRITLYTSGTTGTPKPIQQSVKNLVRSVQISSKHDEDVWGLAYQSLKIAALQVLLQAICNGNTIVNLYERPIAQARELIRNWGITHLSATPTYFRLLAADSSPYTAVRAVTVGGEVCDVALRSKLEGLFPHAKFRNVYASSELGTLLHSSDDCFVVTDTLREFILVREGRLWMHQNLVAENLRDQCENGFWDSGDEVQIVSENPLRIKITGRRSDWINVGGTKVNPHDVEQILCEMPGVVDARVFGVANSVTGQIVAAELSRDGSIELDLATIRKKLQQVLPSTAVPRLMTVRDVVTSIESLKKERHS